MIGFVLAAGAVAGAVAPVTGGTPSGEDAVVALARGSVLVCSATAIAPHLVLTAAHCLSDSQLPDVVEGAALDGAHHAITATFVAPSFDPDTLDHDLALLVIDPAVTATLPYATGLAAVPGDALTVIGFGFTVANDTAPAERRTGTSHLDAIDELRLQSSAAPNQTCEGDSGGPALFAGQIVGVASAGDAACTQFAKHTRVDAHAALIAAKLAATTEFSAPTGERCYYGTNCQTGMCLPALDEPRESFCSIACGTCPSGLACISGACRHPAPSPGAVGATCAGDDDCVGGLCEAAQGSTTTTCTARCFSDLPGFTCPDGYSCTANATGAEACFAMPHDDGCHAAHGDASWLLIAIGSVRARRAVARRRR